MVIKVLYSVFLGALVVLFVGWTMAALLPAPTWETEYGGEPQWESMPQQPSEAELEGLPLAERQARFAEYKQEEAAYDARDKEREGMRTVLKAKTEKRSRNVSLISLVIAVAVVSVSVGLSRRLPVISEGLLLGGLFTLVYSIGFSFIASPKIAVIPVGVGLVVTIALGYQRFAKPPKDTPGAAETPAA